MNPASKNTIADCEWEQKYMPNALCPNLYYALRPKPNLIQSIRCRWPCYCLYKVVMLRLVQTISIFLTLLKMITDLP